MKKPVKKYNNPVPEFQRMNSETEEMFYMCEYIDAYVAKPVKREARELEDQRN